MKLIGMLLIILAIQFSACTTNKAKAEENESANTAVEANRKLVSYFDSGDGVISVPENYREWDFIGTWSVDGEEGAGGIHNVYISPGAVSYYKKNKSFPDGCILVKELMDTYTTTLTTGLVSRAHKNQGWFVMVKDSKNRYPDNNLWGDGWGWSFFEAGNKTKTISTDYKVDCISCHIPAQKNDWIYIEGYPALSGQN